MSNRLKELNSEDLLGMELEYLAVLFLLDFSDMSQPDSMLNFIRNNADGNDYQEISKALSEAFQFLCNEGLLANDVLQGASRYSYFITRKGNQALEYHQAEEALHSLEDDLSRDEQDDPSLADKYWREFLEYCGNNNFSMELVDWNRNNQYCGFCIPDVSDDDIFLAGWRHPNGKQIAANVHLKVDNDNAESSFDALATFDLLKEQETDIQAAFSEDIKWQKYPPFEAFGPVIGVYTNADPATDWPAQFEWLRRNLLMLNKMCRPRILKIMPLV